MRKSKNLTVFLRPNPVVLAAARASDGGRRNTFLTDEWVYGMDGAVNLLLAEI